MTLPHSASSLAATAAPPQPDVARPPPGRGDGGGADAVTLTKALLDSTQTTNDALNFEKQLQATDAADEASGRARAHFVAIGLIVAVVVYFAIGIYSQRFRYPAYFAWYDAMRKETVQGRGVHHFSMSHVCVASTFPPAASMMELGFLWDHLRMESAGFLLMCVEHFRRRAERDPRARLTSLHWSGSAAQTKAHLLTGANGWASAGCAAATVDAKQRTLVRNWNAGKDDNIWYLLLPQPVDEASTSAFLSVPMIRDLFAASGTSRGGGDGTIDACDGSTFFASKLGMLYDGGLCHVAFAQTSSSVSAAEMFDTYFATEVPVRQSCAGAAAAGATQGAVSAGVGLAFVGLAVPGGAEVAAGVALVGALVGGVAGGVTSANAAKETCQQTARALGA